MKKMITFLAAVVMLVAALTGCGGNDDTVQTCIVSNMSYTTENDLESASQLDMPAVDKTIYASIHFIESPEGTEYTVKWYLDGTEIKSETKATEGDIQDIVIYELGAEQVSEGTLKVEVIYKDTTLLSKELEIQ